MTTPIKPITGDLISAPEIAKRTGWGRPRVPQILKFHGCLPAIETPYGRGALRFYNKADVEAAIKRYDEARKPKAPPPPPTVAAPAPTQQPVSFDEIHERLDALEQSLQARDRILFSKLEALATGINLLLDHLTEPKAGEVPKDTLQQLVIPAPKHNPEQQSAEKPAQLSVVVAGLLPAQAALMEKEFGSYFRLRFYTSDQASTSGFSNNLRSADVFLSMVDFVNHKVEEAATNAGVRYIRVAGGMTRLRDQLWRLTAETNAVSKVS